MLMDQSSRDDTVVGVRPPGHPTWVAVSSQSSRDKRQKRSPLGFPLEEEGRAISARAADTATAIEEPEGQSIGGRPPESPAWLRAGGTLVLELGRGQLNVIANDLQTAGFDDVQPITDEDGDLRGISTART